MSLANEIRAIRKSIKDDLAQFKAITDINQDTTELLTGINNAQDSIDQIQTVELVNIKSNLERINAYLIILSKALNVSNENGENVVFNG